MGEIIINTAANQPNRQMPVSRNSAPPIDGSTLSLLADGAERLKAEVSKLAEANGQAKPNLGIYESRYSVLVERAEPVMGTNAPTTRIRALRSNLNQIGELLKRLGGTNGTATHQQPLESRLTGAGVTTEVSQTPPIETPVVRYATLDTAISKAGEWYKGVNTNFEVSYGEVLLKILMPRRQNYYSIGVEVDLSKHRDRAALVKSIVGKMATNLEITGSTQQGFPYKICAKDNWFKFYLELPQEINISTAQSFLKILEKMLLKYIGPEQYTHSNRP